MSAKIVDSATLTAVEACAALNEGRITAEQLAAACMSRIRARDGEVQAWAHLDANRVLEEARASYAARRRGDKIGALAGIPVGIKDIIDTADYPTENGTPVFCRPSSR